jgi:hypothetical protein
MIRVANVIVRQGKAYIPTTAQIEGEMAGAYLDIEPIYVTNLTLDELTEALERVVATGNPKVPTPTLEELERYYSKLVPRAAGVKSWKALARGGASYAIEWQRDKIVLYMSQLDKKGRFVDDPGKRREFPSGTDIRTIAEVILEDVNSRPELLVSNMKP